MIDMISYWLTHLTNILICLAVKRITSSFTICWDLISIIACDILKSLLYLLKMTIKKTHKTIEKFYLPMIIPSYTMIMLLEE